MKEKTEKTKRLFDIKFTNSFLLFITFFCFSLATSFSQITPPLQPASGPGGSSYLHQSVTKNKYGSGGTAYWLYEPANPKPDSANFIVFNHGWGALNPACYGKWIEHLVRKGNIVVFPKWQFDLNTLPQFFTPNAITSVKDAVIELASGNHVKPRYYNTAYIGYSFGGVISSNMAILADSEGIPEPKALLVCNGGNGNSPGSLLPTYTVMPDIKLLIIAGDEDIVVADTFGRMLFDSTIAVNPVFKNHITQYYDGHGSPAIEATHNEPLSWDSAYYSWDVFDNNWVVSSSYAVSKLDAVDFFCYWKFADAIADCAFYGTNCDYVFCKTEKEKFMGKWSDNQPVTELFAEAKEECVTASTGEETEEKKFVIYPNPNKGEFSVGGLDPIAIGFMVDELKIYDMMGTLVFRQTLNAFSKKINLSPGIYFVVLQEGEKILTEKLIIE